jgi:hypothetical protein
MKHLYLKTVNLAWAMLVLSVILYGLEYLVYGRTSEVFVSFLGNFAFLPIYVLFVTLVIERILREREKLGIRQKLNMVIGVFFSEVGTYLLRDFTGFVARFDLFSAQLEVSPQWTARDFDKAVGYIARHEIEVDCSLGDLDSLKEFLIGKREFMLVLMENPNLLEHDDFTDLLWAVFHLTEELAARQNLQELPQNDLEHLAGDIKRVYQTLIRQWILYMGHLMEDYPYLFSLAVRTNPMNPDAKAEIA